MKKLSALYHNLKDIFLLIKAPCSRDLIISLILIILSAAIAPLATWIYKILIDDISSNHIFNSISHTIILIIFVYMILNIILEGIEILNSHISIRLKYNINSEVTKNINNKLSKIQLEELENPRIFDLLDRIQSTVSKEALTFINSFLLVLMPLLSTVTYIILLLNVNVYFPLIAIIATIPYLILTIKQGKNTYFQAVQQSKESRRLRYMYDILTSREHAKEIRLFNLIEYFNDKVDKIRNKLWAEKFKLLIKYCLLGILSDLLRNIALGICLLMTCFDVIHHRTSIGNVILVISSMQAITANLTNIVNKVSSINKFSFYINDWKEFLNLPEVHLGKQKLIEDTTIRFKDVSFQYPNAAEKTLTNIDLEIAPGGKIALVGENGSGKTTLINLLLGLYKPTEGKIYIGRHTLHEVIEDFRGKSVCIFQNFIKYQLSVDENIRAGNFGREINKDMLDVLELNKFINTLPHGMDTRLGQLDEDGYELSGGQWQKLAIARALSRENAEILIMDEPTASLDPKVETQMYEEFASLCKNKTTILISHRLGVTKLCDKIYVFDQGEIIEHGSHTELLELKGKYYNMYLAQSSLYM